MGGVSASCRFFPARDIQDELNIHRLLHRLLGLKFGCCEVVQIRHGFLAGPCAKPFGSSTSIHPFRRRVFEAFSSKCGRTWKRKERLHCSPFLNIAFGDPSWRHMVHYRRCHGLYITLLLASLLQRLFEQYFLLQCAQSAAKDITIAPNSQPVFKFGKNYVFLHFGEVIS